MVKKDCEKDFYVDCGYLEGHNPVRMFCVKACRLAHLDYFYGAELSLQQAAAFVRRDEEERCVEVYQKYIEELRRDRESSLRKEVESALCRGAVEIDESLCQQVEDALIVLQNLIPWRGTQRLVKKWKGHYQASVRERKERCQELLKQARQLVKHQKFAEATQVLDEARAFADVSGKRSVKRIERKIQQHLSQILERVRILAGQDRFDEAFDALKDARKLTAGSEVDLVENVKQEIEETRQRRIQALTGELEALLAKEPEILTWEDMDTGQETSARLQNVHPNPIELEPLVERWREHRQRAEVSRDLAESRRQLETLWQAPSIMLSQYDEALALARQKAREHHDIPQFQDLLKEAERRREEAYIEEGEMVTAVAQGNFAALLAELERLWKVGLRTLPRYGWSRQGGRILVAESELPAEEAISHLQSLARAYDGQKADEYFQRAQAVVSGDPLAAEKWLEEAMDFEYLSPVKRQEIQKYKEQVVVLARERRQRALILVKDAQERRAEDIVAAWQLVQEAYKLAPGPREVMRARDYLRPWLVVHWDKLLRKAEEAIWDGDCEKAAQVADYVLDNVQSEPSLFEDALQKAQHILQRCRHEEVE